MSTKTIVVAKVDEIPQGEARVFEAEGTRIALCKVNNEIYAVEDVCTHDDGPLGEDVEEYAIECPRHGARFDIRDGRVLRMPAAFPVRTFPVNIQDGKVVVELEE